MRFTSFNIFTAFALLVIIGFTVCATGEKKEAEDQYKTLFNRNTRIFAPPLPRNATFAGESIPLNLYYVREALDREIMATTFMHSTTIMMFKRANRWFPVIEPILARNGIPDDFKFLAVAESNLANVVSPAKAEGVWQFLETTGKQYGLEINDQVDERYHLEKATEAACAYFKAAYSKFGQWSLVAAAYNRGSEGLERAIQNQQVNNYFELYLNDETARYLYRIVALKEIYKQPVPYGFYLRESDFYKPVPTRLIHVDSSIASLPLFAKSLSINYRILRELNPWIRNYSLPNKSGKVYSFKIPEAGVLDSGIDQKHDPQSATFFHDSLKINDLR